MLDLNESSCYKGQTAHNTALEADTVHGRTDGSQYCVRSRYRARKSVQASIVAGLARRRHFFSRPVYRSEQAGTQKTRRLFFLLITPIPRPRLMFTDSERPPPSTELKPPQLGHKYSYKYNKYSLLYSIITLDLLL